MSPQIVILSGAASGLGLSLASRFVERGDRVYGVTLTRRHWASAQRAVQARKHFFLFQVDLTRANAVNQFIRRVLRKEKRIDVLINNAGYANQPVRLEKERLKELQTNLSHNLVSTFLMCKYALPFFQKSQRGWIVNIASMAGKRAVPFLAAYSASKFGVLALTQSIAKENPDAGFKCITVCPGGMNTPMRAKLFGQEDASRQQSADFVADKILEILDGKIDVPSGGDISIRHGQVTSVEAAPPP